MIKCKGCGAILQNENPNKEGYVRNLEKDLCERCFKIRHYNEYRFVDKDNNYYLNIIDKINKTNDLVLIVTDFLNTESIKEININNPVILVLTKQDLIPRHIDENKILNNITSNLNIVSKLVVGAKNNYNLDSLFNKINKYKKSNNVYIIGYTNAGKSTLINKMIKNYSESNEQITTSILPSTTLDLIDIRINNALNLIDTPGLLDDGSIILNIKKDTLNKIIPKKEIKPAVIQIKINQTIIIDNLIRLDVKAGTNLIFYISNNLKLERVYKKTDKLKEKKQYNINLKANHDLVIKGLGFIKTTKDTNITLYLDENIKFINRQSLI